MLASSATDPGMLSSARGFLAEFLAFAGRRGIWAAVAVGFGAVLESVGILLIIPLLGIVIGSGAKSGRLRVVGDVFHALGFDTPLSRLSLLLAAFAAIMAIRAVVISYRDVTLAELQIGFLEAQRGGVAELLAKAQWHQLAGLRHARITHLLSGDIQRVGVAAHFFLQLAVALVLLVVQCALAFYLSPLMAAIALVLMTTGAIALVPVLRRARNLGEFVTNANLSLLNSTAQFLGGLKLAISQNLQNEFVTEFEDMLRELKNQQIVNIRQQTNGRLLMTTVSAVVGALLVFVGYGFLHVQAPVLFTLLLIIGRMSGPANLIQQGALQLANALPAYEKVRELKRELADTRPAILPTANPVSIPDGPIVFDRVSFVHPATDDPETPCGVQDVTLRIARGEFIGIIGTSGAGKTTFADLLVTLLAPQSGHISVGGTLLEGSALAAWRESISYVSQDPFLFHDTVRRNLGWANPQASEADMWDVLTMAGAADLVRRMGGGLDTVVGERGTLVSGGERQRIALARALLRRPTLLILDEATSAIDIPGEGAILDRITDMTPRPTIVMIAHRAESLTHCSRILRMEAGRLSEEGVPRDARLHVPQKVCTTRSDDCGG